MRICAYVYPGWHPIAERDASFYPGFTEWDLVYASTPRFEGHWQPRVPAWGRYDDRDPVAVGTRIEAAAAHGIDAVVYGTFWCRGKRVFEAALDEGFLGSSLGADFPFAVMWANRMPRRVLPVRRADVPVIDPSRLVSSDVDDFVALIRYLGERYFARANYLRVDGKIYFSIFDATYFVRELGVVEARLAIERARTTLRDMRLGELHLAAIEPNAEVIGSVGEIGFDSITNYVFLPDWRGPFLQDYVTMATQRSNEWPALARAAKLPYFPSVSPGWDASPRAADFGPDRPQKYPWWPIITGEHPDHFSAALKNAIRYGERHNGDNDLVFVASLNEWGEGHYVEPDTRYGTAWLNAVRTAR